jgi:hypothetical protein
MFRLRQWSEVAGNPAPQARKRLAQRCQRWVEWEIDPSSLGAAEVLTQTLQRWVGWEIYLSSVGATEVLT